MACSRIRSNRRRSMETRKHELSMVTRSNSCRCQVSSAFMGKIRVNPQGDTHMKLNLETALIVAAIVIVTLKFRDELMGLVGKIPVVGSLVA